MGKLPNNYRHGYTTKADKLARTPRWRAYCAWCALKQRCANRNCKDYPHYGGRGITYDPRWEVFENFLADMGEPPIGASLDRRDNDGPYRQGNCRWAFKARQMQNRSNCRVFTYGGETKTMAEWARKLGIGHSALIARMKRGWSIERALSELSSAAPQYKRSYDNSYSSVLSLPG